MTAQDLARKINKTAFYLVGALRLPVEIKDARQSFGRTDLLIAPVGGAGVLWVSEASVSLPVGGVA